DPAGLELREPRLRLPGPHHTAPGRASAAPRAVDPGGAAATPGTPRRPLPGRCERHLLLPRARLRRHAGRPAAAALAADPARRLRRSEEHTSELQSRFDLVCRLL